MKKMKFLISMLAISAVSLTACHKTIPLPDKKDVKQSTHALARVATWSGLYNGHTVKVTYYTGEHPSIGLTASVGGVTINMGRISSACEGNDGFCKPIKLEYNSPIVGTDDNGGKIFTNIELSMADNAYQGFIGISNDGQNLVFATDRTKITSAVYNKYYSGETVDINFPFPLDEYTTETTQINYVHPVIPVGKYILNVNGNILWWEVPINSIIEPYVIN
ncbi:hypothetical protein ACTHGU_18085 [Chitinophagaceae bacterium MMS25-I14]